MTTISLCVICKDEAELLAGCLESAAPSVDEIVVIDTGSTDETVRTAKSLGAKVFSVPWTNFSDARNESLARATGDWVLVLDADEELIVRDADELRNLAASGAADAYSLRVINVLEMSEYVDIEKTTQLFLPRFFRKQGATFINPIHEAVRLDANAKTQFTQSIDIVHYGYLKTIYNDKNKTERNLDILRAWIERDENNPWPHFYLGNQLHRDDRFAEAAAHYEKALKGLLEQKVTAAGADAHKNLADSYQRLNRYDLIAPLLDRAIVEYPDCVELFYFYGLFLLETGQAKASIDKFRNCLTLDEDNPNYCVTLRGAGGRRPLAGLAEAFRALGDIEKARLAAQAAAELDEAGGPMSSGELLALFGTDQ